MDSSNRESISISQSSLESHYQQLEQEYETFTTRKQTGSSQDPVAKQTKGWLRDRFPFHGFHHVLRGSNREWATVPYQYAAATGTDDGDTTTGQAGSGSGVNAHSGGVDTQTRAATDRHNTTIPALGLDSQIPTDVLNQGLGIERLVQSAQESPPAHVLMSTTPKTAGKNGLTLHVPSTEFRSEDEAVQLFELLNNDLGISNVAVMFDGKGGYILHSTGPHTPKLSGEARQGIIDYVTGQIMPEDVLGTEHVSVPETDEVEFRRTLVPTGYGEQVVQKMETYSSLIDDGQIRTVQKEFISLPTVTADLAKQATDTIQNDNGEFSHGIPDESESTYKITMALIRDSISDRSVDLDVLDTNYIPAPGSINAVTGKRVMRVNPANIDNGSFDPVEDTIVDMAG